SLESPKPYSIHIRPRVTLETSAGHVQDGVCFLRVLAQLLNRLDCRQHQQLDMAALGFLFHFVHHRQSACSGADDQPSTFPRDLFLRRKRCVAEIIPEFLGGLLLTLADLPSIDEHVAFVSDPVDADRTKRERLKADRFHCLHCFHFASLNEKIAVRKNGFSLRYVALTLDTKNQFLFLIICAYSVSLRTSWPIKDKRMPMMRKTR